MKNKGITLVVLIVIVIIMIILAGVTIRLITNGGIIDKAKSSSINYMYQADKEDWELAIAGSKDYVTGKINLEELVENLPDWTIKIEDDIIKGISPNKNEFTLNAEDIIEYDESGYFINIKGVTDEGEDADIQYDIKVPEELIATRAKSEAGTKNGSLSGKYPEGTTIDVTVKKDGHESVTKSYTVSDNMIETIMIRKLYALNIQGKAIDIETESDATITYAINVPESDWVEEDMIDDSTTGSLIGNYPKGTRVCVLVTKEGFASEAQDYTMTNEGITDKITIYIQHTYTLTVSNPAEASITFEIDGTLISGNLTGTTSNTVKVRKGTKVSYIVRADGYYSQKGSVTVNEDKTDTIEFTTIIETVDTFVQDANLTYASKTNLEGGKIENSGQLATPCSAGKTGIGNYIILSENARIKVDFVIPSNIPDDADLQTVTFRMKCGNSAHTIDHTVDCYNGNELIDTYSGSSPSDVSISKTKSYVLDLTGYKVSDFSDRIISFIIKNDDDNKFYIRGCDVERFTYKNDPDYNIK